MLHAPCSMLHAPRQELNEEQQLINDAKTYSNTPRVLCGAVRINIVRPRNAYCMPGVFNSMTVVRKKA